MILKIRRLKPNLYEFDYYLGGKRHRPTVNGSKGVITKLKKKLEYLIGAEKLGIKVTLPLPPLDKAFKQYQEFQQSKNLSQGTINQDTKAFKQIKACPHKDLTLYLSKQNYSISTCNMRLRHAKSFFRWCSKQGWEFNFRYDLIKQRESAESRFINADDFKSIYKLMTEKYADVIRILECTGLRRSEFKRIKLEGNNTISVIGKNGLKRYIPVSEIIYKLSDHIPTKINDNQYDLALREFSKCAKKIGSKATPHWIRHTFALRMYFQTRDIRKVQLLLGHTSLKETVKYTKIPDDLMKKYIGENRVPGARLELAQYKYRGILSPLCLPSEEED